MLTVFRERIPDFFMHRYAEEIENWGKNFAKIGDVKSFILKEGYWSESSPDPLAGPVLIQVKLKAKIERGRFGNNDNDRVIISPASDEDEWKIRRHCERMEGLGVQSRLFTKEPPRPWIPFLPRVVGPEK